MKVADPCSVCGSKDFDLVDGYYYCVECGTQDTNVRETILEHKILADGTFAQSTKRKIVKVNEDKADMSSEWYKWHAFNFILLGLADELIALGAAPTFKKKLLWIWTRYIKKHQRKEELGLNNCNEPDKSPHNTTENLSNTENIEHNDVHSLKKKKKKKHMSEQFAKDIKVVTQGLLVTILYVALNLDKSEIQISHIKRMIDEGRLNLIDLTRYIPEGINVKAIGIDWYNFAISCNPINFLGMIKYRTVAMSLLRELDLGTPLLPDIRKMTNNFMKELCLPKELNNLVFSLMHLWPCELDVDYRGQTYLLKVPEYEAVVMGYILVALKMCFGLDGDYEYKLSNIIDKINENNLYPKSYKLGFTPEPTDRLFSFRDWINYLQLRRKMISKYLQFNIDGVHYNDTDDFVFLEHLPERSKGKNLLTDELTMKIVDQIPEEANIDVIPKNEFPWSITPITAYTEVITQHSKDTEVVQFLSEDFTQYSLKYVCDKLELSDFEDSKEIINGISINKKIITKTRVLLNAKKKRLRNKWIYIKNCDNKHWLKTNKPSIEHVTLEVSEKDDQEKKNDKESDHGYDSNLENTPNVQNITDNVCNDVSEVKLEIIKEEEESRNIYDDEFDDMDCKEEDKVEDDNNFDIIQEQIENYNDQQVQSDTEDDKSVTSEQSYEFNPETFNRERAIKELILRACRKYKIPTPKEYKTVEPRKRKHEHCHEETGEPRKKYARSKPGETKIEIGKLLDAYYSNVERDVVGQVAQQVKNVIRNMNLTTEQIGVDDPVIVRQSETNSLIINNHAPNATDMSVVEQNLNEHNATQVQCEQENLESTLFEEGSDIEANIDELIPKGDPKYDEKKYHVDQLYIKTDKLETDDIFDVTNDPEIDKILEEKIEFLKNPSKVSTKITSIRSRGVSTDSEDELPLSIMKEEKEMYSKEDALKENLEPLIKNENIPKFKYWLRHYETSHLLQVRNLTDKFDSELAQNVAETFNFVLRECAFVSGFSCFRLYRSMQILENHLMQYIGQKLV